MPIARRKSNQRRKTSGKLKTPLCHGKRSHAFPFLTKMAYRYFFDPVCVGCLIKEQCHEGFYGIRIERRMSDYWVRLCIYKHTPDVLMPQEAFLKSELVKKLKDLAS